MSSPDVEWRKNKLEDRFLFPGESCFPISPLDANNNEGCEVNQVSVNDQLIKILTIIGTQKEKDLSFISEGNILNFIQALQS